MAFKNRITNIHPVAPGATATVTLGTGQYAPTIDKLQFILSSTAGVFDVSKINGIRGLINGRPFYYEGSGTLHNARRAYLGLFTAPDELVIDFTEPNARSAIEQNLSSIPLSLLQSCVFELDIDATAAASARLQCLAHFRAPTQNPFIKKMFRIPQSFSAGGEQVVYLPNGPAGGKLLRAWIHEETPGNITAVELRSRNAIGIEGTRYQVQNDQKHWGLVPQAGVLVLDFIADGNMGGWFDTQAHTGVELRLTGTAANAYTIYLEYTDAIAHL